ncbi:restriction endonuclease subunit S [Lactococcus lactis subsp. lactis]|uniref:restriction endonuclease subunit S n=1 Tax=Lactococcus lactis TaxID=1358 RepID=UPI0037488E1E
MELKAKEPKVRFGEFTGDWEECKLEDILDEFSSKSRIENEHVVLSSTNSGMEIRGGRVSGNSNLGYKIIEDGDLVLSPQNLWLGNININNIGVGLVSPSYKTFKIKNINSGFLGSQLRMPRMLEAYKNSSTQGASVVRRNLELDSFYQITINTPSKNEQDRINTLFKNINKTIEFRENQLEQLKESKKTLLSKMFPKEGGDRPEIRFAGFTDPWEERKLSDIVVRLSKSSNNNQLPRVEFEDIVAGEGRLNKDVSHKFDDRKGILFEPRNILYGKLRPYLKNWLFADFKGIALGDFWVFKSINSEPKFIYSLIQADNYQRVANDTSGTKMPRSDWKKVSSSYFSIPKSIEEQKKIGEFFKKLDGTIFLHQQELENLKALKKTLLNLMFV